MSIYQGVNGVNQEIKSLYQGLNGVNYKVTDMYQGVNGVNQGIINSPIPITDLSVGSSVNFGKYQVESESPEPITWQIAAHNFHRFPSNSITLVTADLIDVRSFDAMEPTSPVFESGNPFYGYSNIKQWLNKSGMNWYVSQFDTDQIPNTANTDRNTGYDDRPGFLTYFTDKEKNIILNTPIITDQIEVVNSTDRFRVERIGDVKHLDKIFLLSYDDVGGTLDDGGFDGINNLPLFGSEYDRVRYATQQAIDNSTLTRNDLDVGAYNWWLRTPSEWDNRTTLSINGTGRVTNGDDPVIAYGIVCACNVPEDVQVIKNGNYYDIV